MKNIVVIPSYQPDNKLISLVDELSSQNVGILIVNDGSGPHYDHIFSEISDKAEIINLPVNCGKGYALKCGMSVIMNKHPECEYFVTADSDGQHKVADIMRVFDELDNGAGFVLTVRKFRDNMPFKSKIGNNLSRYIYTILNGHYFIDNQSGLRGFLAEHCEWLVRVDGNKYDYEMNMLYYADKQGIVITTIPIEAIYIDNNSSSHFHPVKDTLRIYARLFYSARVSFIGIFLIQFLLALISVLFDYRFLYLTIPVIGATEIIFNVVINRYVVFRRFKYKDYLRTVITSVIRYMAYSLCIFFFAVVMPFIPLFISFNFVMIAVIPCEYYLHKMTYLSRYKDINKER